MDAGARRARGRPAIPREVQRARLIEAAMRAFGRTNFEKTTVAEIVREAGMSSRSFYEHFDSKEAIVTALVHQRGRELLERIAELFEQIDDEIVRIEAALRAYLSMFPAMAVDLDRLGGDAGQRVGELRSEYVHRIRDLVIGEFEGLVRKGRVARVPDPVELELVLRGIEGLTFRYFNEGRAHELESLRPAIVRLMVRAFL